MKYGFIGCGNMGGAIASALSKATKDILLSDPVKGETLAQELGCAWGSNEEAAACDRLFLAVKPQVMGTVLGSLQPALAKYKPTLITMAAGLEIATIEKLAGINIPDFMEPMIEKIIREQMAKGDNAADPLELVRKFLK